MVLQIYRRSGINPIHRCPLIPLITADQKRWTEMQVKVVKQAAISHLLHDLKNSDYYAVLGKNKCFYSHLTRSPITSVLLKAKSTAQDP